MRYSVDTSLLIQGWRTYYPPDVFPGVWDGLAEMIAAGSIRASEEVREELERKDDELLAWADGRADLFVPIDAAVEAHVEKILSTHPKLIDERANRSAADPWVIALALTNGCAVATHEKPSRSRKRPHIPDVCAAYGVNAVPFVEFFRANIDHFGGPAGLHR